MRIKLILLLLILLCNNCVIAQESKIDSLWQIYVTAFDSNDYEKALEPINTIIQLQRLESSDAAKDTLLAFFLNESGIVYINLGQYQDALNPAKEALAIRKKLFGPDHTDVAQSASNLAWLFSNIGQYEDALPLYQEALAIDKEICGELHLVVAKDQHNLAELFKRMKKYKEAILLNESALATRREILGENHQEVGISLRNKGLLYYADGQYEKAVQPFEQTLAICKKNMGEDSPDLASDLTNLARVYKKMGQFPKALTLFEKALSIRRKLFLDDNVFIAVSFADIAIIYSKLDRNDMAIQFYEYSLAIFQKIEGPESTNVAKCFNNLALIYIEMAQFERAGTLLERALNIYKKTDEKDYSAIAISLSNLARVEQQFGKFEISLYYLEQALAIVIEAHGDAHPSVAAYLNDLAVYYLFMGQYEKAISFFLESLAIKLSTFGVNHPSVALGKSNLAELYFKMGQYEKAIFLTEEALVIFKKSSVVAQHELSACLQSLSFFYSKTGQFRKVLVPLMDAVSIETNHVKVSFIVLSESQKMEYLMKRSTKFHWLQSFSYNHSDLLLKNKKPVFNAQLFLNGVVLRSSLALSQAVYSSGDSLLEQDYNHFISLKIHYAQSVTKTIEELKNAEINLRVIEDSIEVVERRLSLRSKEFANDLVKEEIGFDDLIASLSKDAAYVYFSSFSYHNGKSWTDSIIYTAYVIRPQDKVPEQIRLFEQRALDSLLSKQKSGVGVNEVYGSSALYDLIWKPLLPSLLGSKQIYFSCSGALHSIAFSALQDSAGRTLCDKYSLHQISGPAQLVIPSSPVLFTMQSSSNKDIALFGGIDYQADSAAMKLAVTSFITDTTFMFATRSMLPQETDRGSVWQPLPGTMQEVESIEKLFVGNARSCVKYTGAMALEEQVKSQQEKQAPKILHIATHGFFIPAPKEDLNKLDIQLRMSGDNAFQRADNPLLRSGLLFAGSAHTWKGEASLLGAEDGILTAMEVAQLNLRNTRLSVLSACETGLGDVKGSEGVFGLQRAFKLAGVDYILMSLWSIPDKETNEYMQYFYGELLSTNNINTAYQTAQNKMRSRYPDEPQKWAGMVLVD
jgi:tetratricopeptide (TPR) repeat protein